MLALLPREACDRETEIRDPTLPGQSGVDFFLSCKSSCFYHASFPLMLQGKRTTDLEKRKVKTPVPCGPYTVATLAADDGLDRKVWTDWFL